jgi:hypothetical protein
MMEKLEKQIPVLLCKLEKILPPGFFNPMEHLLIHIPYEAKVGGPVQYRWMHFFWRPETAENKPLAAENSLFPVASGLFSAVSGRRK